MTENKLLRALQSRKLWMAIVGFVSIIWVSYQSGSALDPETVVNAILGIVAAYIAATAWEDGKQAEAVGKMLEAERTPVSSPVQVAEAQSVNITESKPE